ncbi:MAG: DUF1858 domain-containing protein [Acidobacteria bacterium]|nr:DUF1858 domain-containing protein [Acidobacteriota bacterium]
MDHEDTGLRISPDIQVEELVRLLPRAPALLREFGIVCIQCGEPVWGTLRQAAADKGITDLAPVLARLREAARG